jgi:tetratricopeptide (TPR) repeat protein
MSEKSSVIKEAQKYIARGQIDKAILEWEKLIKEYPDGNTYNTIGDLYLRAGDKINSVVSFHKAAEFFRNQGFSLKAVALYKKILNINSSDSDALFSLGELSEEKGFAKDAIKYYLASADNLPKEGKKEKFIEIYKKVLALSPANISLRKNLAEIYAGENLMSDAANQYIQIARLYSENGDMEKSLEYYHKTMDIEHNKEAVLEINALYERSGDIKQALQHIEEATTLFPQDMDIHLRCAELYLAAGKIEKARECLTRVIEAEPANVKAKKLLGDIYLREGNKDKAWTEYQVALDGMILDEKSDELITILEAFKDIDPLETGKRLVFLYRQLGDQVQAANELISIGDIFAGKDMQKEALNYYKEALTINPGDDSLRDRVNELEEEVGKDYVSIKADKLVDEAIVEADTALENGLYENVKDLLLPFRESESGNTDLHERLKTLYIYTGDKEQAVTEFLILNELYKKAGDSLKAEQMIKEAFEIYPEDPRLTDMAAIHQETVLPDEHPEAEAIPEPALDKEVEGVFNEFKKGLEKQLEKDDHETHYNLAIAYKEMGLIDDAIREFQLSLNGLKWLVPSSTMLGVCYVEKGLYLPAIDVLKNAIDKMEDKDESYWAMKYDLAEVYEKNNNIKEALESYMDIFGWNSEFRAVSDKITQLKVKVGERVETKKHGRKDRVSYL